MAKLKLPDFEAVWAIIDQGRVREALYAPDREGRVLKFGLDELANIDEMLESAARKWLPRDLVELQIDAVEERSDFKVGADTIKCYIDVEATMRGTMKPFDAYLGKKIIIDWKTRNGELDQPWRERCIDSWQWRMYAHARNASVISYRGVSSRCCGDSNTCGTKEILIGVHPTNSREVEEHTAGLLIQRNSLIASGLEVWPRNMRDACFKFGYECPFKDDCDHYTMPKYVPDKDKEMSYTSFSYFMRCPEYARRMSGVSADESDESKLGSGFHLGIAEIYRQARTISL